MSRTPPRITRRRSPVAGWGVFACDGINKNARGLVWCFIIDRR